MKFTVPDICDEFYEKIQIGDSFYNSYGGIEKFYGEIQTVQCEHSNSVVKDIVKNNGKGKVLFISQSEQFDLQPLNINLCLYDL